MAASSSLATALPYANAALFALQILLTWFAFSHSDAVSQYETPITPAPFAFAIWNPIYFFTLMTVITDVAFPGLSVFNYATDPTPLRVCFALSCVFNAGWALLFNVFGLINVATVDITLLWLVLLPIYLFLTVESGVRPLRWRQYLCSELSIRLYFSWITAATVVSWTISFQNFSGGFLSLASYTVLLGLLVVVAIVGVVYGQDPVIGLVGVWACIGITQKDSKLFPVGVVRENTLRLQAAATLAAGVVAAVVVVSVIEQTLSKRRYVPLRHPQQPDHEALAQSTPGPSPSVTTAPSTPQTATHSAAEAAAAASEKQFTSPV